MKTKTLEIAKEIHKLNQRVTMQTKPENINGSENVIINADNENSIITVDFSGAYDLKLSAIDVQKAIIDFISEHQDKVKKQMQNELEQKQKELDDYLKTVKLSEA